MDFSSPVLCRTIAVNLSERCLGKETEHDFGSKNQEFLKLPFEIRF